MQKRLHGGVQGWGRQPGIIYGSSGMNHSFLITRIVATVTWTIAMLTVALTGQMLEEQKCCGNSHTRTGYKSHDDRKRFIWEGGVIS